MEAGSGEVLKFSRHEFGELEFAFDDFPHGFFFFGLEEGRGSGSEFVGEDSDGPEID